MELYNILIYIYRLIDNFKWDKAFLIIGAIVLLCVLFGALFRPLDSPSNISETTSNATSNQDVDVDEEKSSIFKIPFEQEKSISVNHSFAIGPHIDGNDSFINNYHNNTINSPVSLLIIFCLLSYNAT